MFAELCRRPERERERERDVFYSFEVVRFSFCSVSVQTRAVNEGRVQRAKRIYIHGMSILKQQFTINVPREKESKKRAEI